MDSEVFYVCDAGWRESSYDTLARARQEAWDWVTATAGPRDNRVAIYYRTESGQKFLEEARECHLCGGGPVKLGDTPDGPQVFCANQGCGCWLGNGWQADRVPA